MKHLLIIIILLKLLPTYSVSKEINTQIIEEELESLYHYPHDKITLALKYAKSKQDAIQLIERMSQEALFYSQLLEVSKQKDDSMNIYNPIRDHYEMIIIVRIDLKMSIGKTASQVGHAVLMAYKQAIKLRQETVTLWELSGQAKIVLGINTLEELMDLKRKADSLSIPNSIIADAGYTEVLPNTVTCIGIGPGKVAEISQIRGKLNLL